MNKAYHNCKRIGTGKVGDAYRPDLPAEVKALIPAKTEINKSYFIWQLIKENPDGTFDINVERI